MNRGLWMLMALLLGLSGIAASADDPVIRWRNDRLTVAVESLPVSTVLEAVRNQTGAVLRGRPVADKSITIQLDRTSLEDGLHRILGEQNFTVRYGANGQPSSIELLGGPEEPVAVTNPPPAESAKPERAPLPLRLGFPKSFPSRRNLDLPEALQKAAGAKSATFDEAFDMATMHQETLTRVMASQIVLSQVERDRRVRRSVLSAMARFDDETLRSFRGTTEGDRVHDLLEFLSAHSREPSLQHKAGIALDRFNAAVAAAD